MSNLRAAAAKGDITELQILLDDGEDFLAADRNGEAALHLAAYEGHLNVMQELIEAGVELDTQNKNGQTALHLCSIRGHRDIVRLLVQQGANKSTQTKYSGMTALHLASHNGHLDVVQVLLDTGEDNILDNIGKNAEFYSINRDVRQVFIKHKLEVDKRSPIFHSDIKDKGMEGIKEKLLTDTHELQIRNGGLTTGHNGTSIEQATTLIQVNTNKRRKSRSHSLEKTSYSKEKENTLYSSPLAKQNKKSKKARHRSQSVDKIHHGHMGSETDLLTRPEPIKIEESEEVLELQQINNTAQRRLKHEDLQFPPIQRTQNSNKKTNTVAITDKKFDFSEKHKKRMQLSVFDRLTGGTK